MMVEYIPTDVHLKQIVKSYVNFIPRASSTEKKKLYTKINFQKSMGKLKE